MEDFTIKTIGKIKKTKRGFAIDLLEQYHSALINLDGYSHLQVVWWGHLHATEQNRDITVLGKLFKNGPEAIGVFATRAPIRPNPLLISNIKVDSIDYENGMIYTPFIDAEDESPVLDIKPYQTMERIKHCRMPEWCNHWPEWQEEASVFNWKEEINM